MSQPESRLQRRIRDALEREIGGYWYKVHGGPYQPKGLPDLCGVVRGRSCWVEVKMPDGEVSAVQVVRMRELMDAGAAVCVATTPDEAVEFVRVMLEHPHWRFCFRCMVPRVMYLDASPVAKHYCDGCGRADR